MSNSPFRTPARNAVHSRLLNTCGALLTSLESRNATRPLGRCATSTQPVTLEALLLNQRALVKSGVIPTIPSMEVGAFVSGDVASHSFDECDCVGWRQRCCPEQIENLRAGAHLGVSFQISVAGDALRVDHVLITALRELKDAERPVQG